MKSLIIIGILGVLGAGFFFIPKSENLSAHDSIEFIDNPKEIQSFEELIAPYKGKVLFVDLWATWCPPCKAQFQYKDGLKTFIDDKDIELIYFSFDRPGQEGKWKGFVEDNHLTGFHAYAYPQLAEDIRQKFSRMSRGRKGLTLPTYIIVDRDGQIVNKDAPRPSEGKRLYKQLASYL